MSRLCILKLCRGIRNTGTPEPQTLLSRMRFRGDNRLNEPTCWSCQRGYAQHASLLASRFYPLYTLFERTFFNFPPSFSTITRDKYNEYDDKYDRRHYKYFGMLLGSLGFVVAFCDTSHFKGEHAVITSVKIYLRKVQ